MLQESPADPNIQRSLDRLRVFMNDQLENAIPAFSYTAHELLKYAQKKGVQNVDYRYFQEFKNKIEAFMKRDFSKLKKHQQQIIDDLLETIDSEIFIECLQPQAIKSRSSLLQGENDYIQASSQSQLVINDPQTKQMLNRYPAMVKQMEDTQNNIKTTSSENPGNEAEQAYEELLLSYKQHRIDEAYQRKNQYQIKYQKQMTKQKEQLFNTIELQYNTMIGFYRQFDLQGWILDKVENGVRLQYKLFEEEKQIAIRIESEFKVPIENFLAILSEMDLFGNYVPFCYDSRQMKVISRNQKIGTSKIYIPCLTDRQTYFYAAGYDRFNVNGSVFLYSKTINEDLLYQEKYGFKVPEKGKLVRLQYKFFIVEYIPINRDRARVRLASKVDMKLNYLPQFIVNMSARKFAFDYFKNIIKMNKKFEGSEWQKKIKENPDFYNFFRKKIDQYMGKK